VESPSVNKIGLGNHYLERGKENVSDMGLAKALTNEKSVREKKTCLHQPDINYEGSNKGTST